MSIKSVGTKPKDHIWLENRGWRKVGEKRLDAGSPMSCWDHPKHQPNRHGVFSTADAIAHQRRVEMIGCDCIQSQEEE